MRVRPARREDAAAIADVHTRTWRAAYEHVFGAERLAGIGERRLSQWEARLVDLAPDWRIAVAEADARVAGFVWTGDSRDEAGEGELFAIYVLPEAWGSGAGAALMADALEALGGRYSSATLWVLEDNPRARRFYEREGWIDDGARREEEFLGLTVAEVRYRMTFD